MNNYLEVECELRSTDKEERDKSDAKNTLEELVYAIRDRLYGSYDGYIQEVEKSNLNKQCDELEDWLYGDGEDQPKSKKILTFITFFVPRLGTFCKNFLDVYSERRSNLQAVVTPVDQRIKEFEGRPKAIERLTDTLNKYQKVTIIFRNMSVYKNQKYRIYEIVFIDGISFCPYKDIFWFIIDAQFFWTKFFYWEFVLIAGHHCIVFHRLLASVKLKFRIQNGHICVPKMFKQ